MSELPFLAGYPPALVEQARALLAERGLGASIARRYPDAHAVRNDRDLQAYVGALKARHLRSAPPLAKVAYDNHVHVVHRALGTHTTVTRVQGARLQARREIRIASVFREAPAAFLRMIAIHELAHLRERDHGKAFYALCTHMEPAYHQLEFDTRLWLTARALEGPAGDSPPG